MPDYKVLYAILCGAASDALDAMEKGETAGARAILQAGLTRAEELVLGDEEG